MTRSVKRLALLCVFVVGVIVAVSFAWKQAYPSYSWHYKITVEIETPEGIKSGSAVRKVAASRQPKFPSVDMPSVVHDVYGEAVVVDLGKRGVVFALMSNQSWQNGLYQAFPTEAPSSKKGIAYYKKTLKPGMKGTWETWHPRMVTFSDLKDPKSVKLVYSQGWGKKENGFVAEDHLEEVFGTGVRLKKIAVEITDDALTSGIAKWLPWLGDYYNRRLDGNRYGTIEAVNKTANALSAGAFSTGEQK